MADPRKFALIDYTNHRGVRKEYLVQPLAFEFSNSDWHPGGTQWIMQAIVVGPNHLREFAMKNIHKWSVPDA